LPHQRNFLIAAGLEQVVDHPGKLRFDQEDLAWLRAKQYWPGAKQIFRSHDAGGAMTSDMLAPQDQALPGEALLKPVMRAGTLIKSLPSPPQIRIHASAQIAALPTRLPSLEPATPFPVVVAATPRELAQQVDARQQVLAQQDRARWATN
jgi:hypothetical protein